MLYKTTTDFIKRLIYRLGFIIKLIPDKDRFYEELAYAHEAVHWHELNKLSISIRNANDHKLYNDILKKYVPAWDSNFTRAEFVGKGYGEYGLSVYRKVRFDKKQYFEKVYFNNCYALLKVEWFYEQIYPVIKNHIKAPGLHKIIKGDLITIIYFDYIDPVPLSKEVMLSVSLSLSKHLLNATPNAGELSKDAPGYLKEYSSHFEYSRSIEITKEMIERLSTNRLTADMIEQVTSVLPLVITHGDIHFDNIFTGNYLIDWDSFGFFPHGFEVARILAKQLEDPTFERLLEILNGEYRGVISEDQWYGFELSCLYFYLIFSALNDETASTTTLQKEVVNRLVNLYNKETAALSIKP